MIERRNARYGYKMKQKKKNEINVEKADSAYSYMAIYKTNWYNIRQTVAKE